LAVLYITYILCHIF